MDDVRNHNLLHMLICSCTEYNCDKRKIVNSTFDYYEEEITALKKEREKLREAVRELRSSLRFYSDMENHIAESIGNPESRKRGCQICIVDRGMNAFQTLKKTAWITDEK